ncbi:hypothetical protein ACIRG5_24345 [Lentzea sp. NPDC102401]|uniref:hypothetical protein n=1 Tax=Lentzea sp. NPDC102401 TaxID=3364128 RepID=UPI0037FCAAEA
MTTPLLVSGRLRYADVRDRRLAAMLAEEDAAEELGLNPLERVSCRLHRRWLHHCVHSPDHVIKITGHRWCRDCSSVASVGVDELTGDVLVRCGSCESGRGTGVLPRPRDHEADRYRREWTLTGRPSPASRRCARRPLPRGARRRG